MSASRSWPKRIALAVAAVLIATWSSLMIPGYALGAPGGNNGVVKVGSHGSFPANQNDPHITCPIDLQWTNFDPAGATYDVTFSPHAPTGGAMTVTGDKLHDTFTGGTAIRTYGFTFTDPPQPGGEWHVQADINTTDANGSNFKSKTFWVASCAAPAQTATLSGSCNSATHTYDWTITTSPVAQISGTYTPQSGAQTNYQTAAPPDGTIGFSTGHVNQVSFTVPAGWTASPQATVTATASNACAAPNPSASATATCNTLSATLNAGTTATTFTVNEPGGSHSVPVAASGTQTVTYTPAAGATITVSANNTLLATGTAPANCGAGGGGGGGNPTPANATATSTCAAASVHLDAGSTATDFTVTEPGGTHQVHVPANQTQDISYSPGAGVTISVTAGGTTLASATAPGTCGTPPPGQAQPDATATDACVSGITVVLSNMNGTAPATFTVTGPDGTSTTVPVNAGQLKKLEFAVAEDTTGVVTVSAPGLARTFTYAKNCTQVLGEKHKKPPHKSTPPPTQVKGEKSQLPFTGFDTRGTLFDAASLVALGAIVCGLAMPRRRRFAPPSGG